MKYISRVPEVTIPLLLLLSTVSLDIRLSAASPPNRQKYVLSVGINEYKQKPLFGCVNDAQGIRELLVEKYGFNSSSSKLLTDSMATRKSILGNIDSFSEIVKEGDLFVFFYSGHGSLFPDRYSLYIDEDVNLDLSYLRNQGVPLTDGHYDSAIVPFDASDESSGRPWNNLILDDELYIHFSKLTNKGATVILISDSCHSGTLAKSLDIENRSKFIDPSLIHKPLPTSLPTTSKTQAINFEGRYLAITSSADNEISIDSTYEEKRQGAFTFALTKVLSSSVGLSVNSILSSVQKTVKKLTNGSQTPGIDPRYYTGDLSKVIFDSSVETIITVSLKDSDGNGIREGSFILFKRDIKSIPNPIRKEHSIVILRTKDDGRAISEVVQIIPGEYLVKVVAEGYKSHMGLENVTVKHGFAELTFVLFPE